MSGRVKSLKNAELKNKKYFKRHRIRDYLPLWAIYSLGSYPAKIDAAPTDYDKALLSDMAKGGVQVIQLHEEWNDAVRLYGGDKFNAPDKEGMKEFVRYCHSLGMKVVAYVSSGYFQETDPDFKEEYSPYKKAFACNYFKYRKCSHASEAWREYIVPKTFYVMDEYGFDGIFNDWGYDGTHSGIGGGLPEYDEALEDLLSIIYSGVKARGGIYKMHCDRNNAPPCKDKVYDYLWIGEWVENSPIGVGKDYEQYITPCLDRHRSENLTQKQHFVRTIPFMQFPLLKHGRPLTGDNVDLPNVTYYGGDEQEFFANVKEYMTKNPNGPYVYSLWSSIPDDITEYDLWMQYAKLYLPMVSENSVAYIELTESDYILSPITDGIYASMFVNEKTYLVISNITTKDFTLKLSENFVNRQTGKVSTEFKIPHDDMIFLVLDD